MGSLALLPHRILQFLKDNIFLNIKPKELQIPPCIFKSFVRSLGAWGPFFENPGNFSDP